LPGSLRVEWRQPHEERCQLVQSQGDLGIKEKIFLGTPAAIEAALPGMKDDDFTAVHRHDRYGSQGSERFQAQPIRSLNQNGLLNPAAFISGPIVDRGKGPQGAKLVRSLRKAPDKLS